MAFPGEKDSSVWWWMDVVLLFAVDVNVLIDSIGLIDDANLDELGCCLSSGAACYAW